MLYNKSDVATSLNVNYKQSESFRPRNWTAAVELKGQLMIVNRGKESSNSKNMGHIIQHSVNNLRA